LLTFSSANLENYTILGQLAPLSKLLRSELKMKLMQVEGGTCPSAP